RGIAGGFSEALLGGLTSAYYAGYFIGTFAMPPLIRRIGHIRAFAFCTACAACMVVNLCGLALGQQLLRIPGEPFVLFAVVGLLVCAATLPVLVTHQAQPQQQATPKLQLGL